MAENEEEDEYNEAECSSDDNYEDCECEKCSDDDNDIIKTFNKNFKL